MRHTKEFKLEDPKEFKKKLLLWSENFEEVSWLDSNNYPQKSSSFDALLAVQAFTVLRTDFPSAFDKLREYQETTADWIFGYLSYDLKNDVEDLTSNNFDGLGFPDLYFFQPAKIIQVRGDLVLFHYLRMVDDEMDADLEEILSVKVKEREIEGLNEWEGDIDSLKNPGTRIHSRVTKSNYLEKVQKMLDHIHRGDIYEANLCQEFYAEDIELEPLEVFNKLNRISGTPFAVFFKFEENFLLSASPERYLRKEGNRLSSMPIKGTARRSTNEAEDNQIAEALAGDGKERSENIMIVDLVRNDLSRIAKKGSVEVEELCKVYSFKQVHQMISTVTAKLEENIPPVESLRATFPMGSMTGAPKISAMKIIEELEETKRGLYSGAVGYFTPAGDFDFNVVIRSILYSRSNKYVSFSVGGAITSRSVPEKEYEECLLKSKAMREVLK